MSGSYENVYGSPLLDDLHNYYPSILYDGSRFSSVADVIAYFQEQTRNRFDLYSYGMNQYRNRNLGSSAATATRRPVYTTGQFTTEPPIIPLPRSMTRDIQAQWADIDAIMGGGNQSSTLELLGSLMSGLQLPRLNRAPSNFMAPVVVRPSEQQINAGSRVDFVGALTDTPCAICQSDFIIGDERRTLNVCSHEFHRGCIDPWFQENVRCPVCRHDIRERDQATL